MIYAFYGAEEFLINERLKEVKQKIQPHELVESNYAEFDLHSFKPAEVAGLILTPPFLAPVRVIVIHELLESVESHPKEFSGSGWGAFVAALKDPAPTSEVVFIDKISLRRNGGGLSLVPTAEPQEYKRLYGDNLLRWLAGRFKLHGGYAEPMAVQRLEQLCTTGLRTIDSEVRKLVSYAENRPITVNDVELMVPESIEANIFRAVDAAVERKPAQALRLLYSLLDDGQAFSTILAMLARQTRMLLQAAAMLAKRVPEDDIKKQLNIRHAFVLRKTLRQARRLRVPTLKRMHTAIYETDLAVKTGKLDERVALETLFCRLALM